MAKRKHNVHFRVNIEEEELIKRKMEDAGISSVAAYMRKWQSTDMWCGWIFRM